MVHVPVAALVIQDRENTVEFGLVFQILNSRGGGEKGFLVRFVLGTDDFGIHHQEIENHHGGEGNSQRQPGEAALEKPENQHDRQCKQTDGFKAVDQGLVVGLQALGFVQGVAAAAGHPQIERLAENDHEGQQENNPGKRIEVAFQAFHFAVAFHGFELRQLRAQLKEGLQADSGQDEQGDIEDDVDHAGDAEFVEIGQNLEQGSVDQGQMLAERDQQ